MPDPCKTCEGSSNGGRGGDEKPGVASNAVFPVERSAASVRYSRRARDGTRFVYRSFRTNVRGRPPVWVWLQRGRRREECQIAEVSATEAGPVLRDYVSIEPITGPFFDAPVNAPVAAFAAEAAKHPVFSLLVAENADG